MKDFLSKYSKQLGGFLIFLIFAFFFTDILIYILIATFFSILGSPMVRWLESKKKLGHTASVFITFLTMIMVFVVFILFIVPLIIYQANIISSIDLDQLVSHYKDSFFKINEFLVQYGIVNPEQSFASWLKDQLGELVNVAKFTNVFASLVSTTGSVVMGTFITIFLTFYFLHDESLVRNFILLLTPENYLRDMEMVLHHSKSLLVRYFYGILMEVGIMMTIESTLLLILDVPNAILIGFLGGLLNIIPYLGPLLGAMIGMVLAGMSELAYGTYDDVFSSIFYVAMVFLGANLIDNTILQPQIYSKSVKAHPVEIFLVIIIGGRIGGVVGMIFAIPFYTVVKVIAHQLSKRIKVSKEKAENQTVTAE
jgi:predicted PurR-regulated permease PerM